MFPQLLIRTAKVTFVIAITYRLVSHYLSKTPSEPVRIIIVLSAAKGLSEATRIKRFWNGCDRVIFSSRTNPLITHFLEDLTK